MIDSSSTGSIGFYPTDPIWVGDIPNFKEIIATPEAFEEGLAEIVFSITNSKYALSVCRDGLITFKIAHLENLRENESNNVKKNFKLLYDHLIYINALQLLLSSSTIKVLNKDFFHNHRAINKSEIFTINNKGKPWPHAHSWQGMQNFLGRKLSQYNVGVENSLVNSQLAAIENHTRILERKVVSLNVLEKWNMDFLMVVNDFEIIKTLSQVNKSISEYKNLNFRESLMQSWFVIELFINRVWISFLKKRKTDSSNPNRINKDRKNFLLGRDFTSSVMTNILELTDEISYEIFVNIDSIRSKRNKIIHNLESIEILSSVLKNDNMKKSQKEDINNEDCRKAFDVIIYFFQREFNIDLKISASYFYYSI